MSITITFPLCKYTTWYHNIMNKARSETRVKHQKIYYENHHILPKCLGGDKSIKNMVLLTAKEHYISHCLLVFIFKKHNNKKYHKQMVNALFSFIMNFYHNRYIIPSYKVIKIRKLLSESKKGVVPNVGPYTEERKKVFLSHHWTKKGLPHPLLNKNHSNESKEKISLNNSKYIWTIIDPFGNKIITKQVRKFCIENNMSIDSVNLWFNKGIIPNVNQHGAPNNSIKRKNMSGWSFSRKSIFNHSS